MSIELSRFKHYHNHRHTLNFRWYNWLREEVSSISGKVDWGVPLVSCRASKSAACRLCSHPFLVPLKQQFRPPILLLPNAFLSKSRGCWAVITSKVTCSMMLNLEYFQNRPNGVAICFGMIWRQRQGGTPKQQHQGGGVAIWWWERTAPNLLCCRVTMMSASICAPKLYQVRLVRVPMGWVELEHVWSPGKSSKSASHIHL